MSDLRTAAQMALRALELRRNNGNRAYDEQADKAISNLRTALAAEPQPVGRVFVEDGAVHINPLHRDASHPDALKDGQRVYTAAPTAQPLTDEQIGKEFNRRISDAEDDVAFDLVDFKAGVRFAEKHFGIGGTHG